MKCQKKIQMSKIKKSLLGCKIFATQLTDIFNWPAVIIACNVIVVHIIDVILQIGFARETHWTCVKGTHKDSFIGVLS